MFVPLGQILQPFLEKGGFEVLKEVDTLKVGNSSVRDICWGRPVRCSTARGVGDIVGLGLHGCCKHR